MEEWVRQNFGKDHLLTHTKMVIKPVRGGCSKAALCRLDPEENIRLYQHRHFQFVKRAIGQEDFDCQNIRFEFKKSIPEPDLPKRLSLFGCDAGMNTYAITWDGKLLGCQIMGGYHTEPYRNGFEKSWTEYPGCVVPMDIDPKCLQCNNAQLCLSCFATRFAESGGPCGISEYICQNAKRIAECISAEEENDNENIIQESVCPL